MRAGKYQDHFQLEIKAKQKFLHVKAKIKYYKIAIQAHSPDFSGKWFWFTIVNSIINKNADIISLNRLQ